MLTCENISKSFKKDFWSKEFFALENITFNISGEKIVGFLGANGAGKTTLIKIILGFIQPNHGRVKIFDLNHDNIKLKKMIGYMPERPYYYQNLSGHEFLNLCGRLQDLSKAEVEQAVSKWARILNIDFALDRTLKGYSKGMLQRIGFVSALLHNPKLIILDEPLSGLDPVGRHEFKDVIKLVNSEGVGIFFSSHIVSDVEEVCEDVVVLEKGEIVYNGSINKLVSSHSNNEVIIEFLDDGKSKTTTVEKKNLNNELSALIDAGHQIISSKRKIVSLEDIVYRLNQ